MDVFSSRTARCSGVASPSSTIACSDPASSRRTRPYGSGSGGSIERTGTAASSLLCAATSPSRTRGVRSGAAPSRTRTSPEKRSSAGRAASTASPVPNGSAWTASSVSSGSVRASSSRVSGEQTTTNGSGPSGWAAASAQSSTRRPSSGWRCLGSSERIRVPRPAASTTAARAGVTRGWAWLGREDSNLRSRDQNPLPYRLATPQCIGDPSRRRLEAESAALEEQRGEEEKREDDENRDRDDLHEAPEKRHEEGEELRDGERPRGLSQDRARDASPDDHVQRDRDDGGADDVVPAVVAEEDEQAFDEGDEKRAQEALGVKLSRSTAR